MYCEAIIPFSSIQNQYSMPFCELSWLTGITAQDFFPWHLNPPSCTMDLEGDKITRAAAFRLHVLQCGTTTKSVKSVQTHTGRLALFLPSKTSREGFARFLQNTNYHTIIFHILQNTNYPVQASCSAAALISFASCIPAVKNSDSLELSTPSPPGWGWQGGSVPPQIVSVAKVCGKQSGSKGICLN